VASQALNACTACITDQVLARVGVGGPQLSNAAFNTGVQRLKTVLNNKAQQQLQFEQDQAQKSFTDQYGEHLATHMYKMTGAADDDHLPEVHKILAKAPKGQYYAILGSYVQKRSIDSPVAVFSGNLPTLTTKIVDQVSSAPSSLAEMETFLGKAALLSPSAAKDMLSTKRFSSTSAKPN
jgi:hypothetical protein